MSKIRRALTFVAALALYALRMPISASAATPTTIEVGSSAEFDNAVATVNAATSGEYIIKLTNDLEGVGAGFANTCPTTILGNGHTIALGQYSSISVGSGAQLNLGAADGSDTLKISGGNEQNTMYLACCISRARAICTPALPLPTVKGITTSAAA